MKRRSLVDKRGMEISSTLVEWIFAILLLVVLLLIIYGLKGKQSSIIEKIREILLFR